MTEQEHASALADELEDSELIISPLSGERDLRGANAAEKATVIDALRRLTSPRHTTAIGQQCEEAV